MFKLFTFNLLPFFYLEIVILVFYASRSIGTCWLLTSLLFMSMVIFKGIYLSFSNMENIEYVLQVYKILSLQLVDLITVGYVYSP